jgi:hypothetical protein
MPIFLVMAHEDSKISLEFLVYTLGLVCGWYTVDVATLAIGRAGE